MTSASDTALLLRPAVFRSTPSLSAGFSTRHGGTSPAPFDTLNLGLGTGDAAEAVQQNRRRFFTALDFTSDRVAEAEQVHGARVEHVEAPGLVDSCDGLVTNVADLLLVIRVADCAAVLLADPWARVIGACHAGWRGVARNIGEQTVRRMGTLGADPGRMLVYVSPCISVARFEVGPEVAAQFHPAFVRPPLPGGRPHVDLKAALHRQLRDAGVPASQIAVSAACTASQTRRFFSHRAEHGRTGRMMGAIALCADHIPDPKTHSTVHG